MSAAVMPDECRSCHAAIVRLRHVRTGAKAPINSEPVANGNLTIDLEEGTYAGPLHTSLLVDIPEGERFVSHFATCPDAARWR
jgi:hypothetical protein